MPFKSKAQRGYLYVHDPKVAREFQAHTPKGADLPEHANAKMAAFASAAADYLCAMFGLDAKSTATVKARARGMYPTPSEMKAAMDFERDHGSGSPREKASKVGNHLAERPAYYVELGKMLTVPMSGKMGPDDAPGPAEPPKQQGGPFIGPKGGKWADPGFTIPWQEGGAQPGGGAAPPAPGKPLVPPGQAPKQPKPLPSADMIGQQGMQVANAIRQHDPQAAQQLEQALEQIVTGLRARQAGAKTPEGDNTIIEQLKEFGRAFNASAAPESVLGHDLGGMLEAAEKARKKQADEQQRQGAAAVAQGAEGVQNALSSAKVPDGAPAKPGAPGAAPQKPGAAPAAPGGAPGAAAPPAGEEGGAATVPMMSTRDQHQQLADLGYTQQDRLRMTPQQVQEALANGKTKPVDMGFKQPEEDGTVDALGIGSPEEINQRFGHDPQAAARAQATKDTLARLDAADQQQAQPGQPQQAAAPSETEQALAEVHGMAPQLEQGIQAKQKDIEQRGNFERELNTAKGRRDKVEREAAQAGDQWKQRQQVQGKGTQQLIREQLGGPEEPAAPAADRNMKTAKPVRRKPAQPAEQLQRSTTLTPSMVKALAGGLPSGQDTQSGGPVQETPAIPDYQDIYFQPPDDDRKRREDEANATRRQADGDKAQRQTFHGTGEVRLDPILYYVPAIRTMAQVAGTQIAQRAPLVVPDMVRPRLDAGGPQSPKDGNPVATQTDAGRVSRSPDRRDDALAPAAPMGPRPSPVVEDVGSPTKVSPTSGVAPTKLAPAPGAAQAQRGSGPTPVLPLANNPRPQAPTAPPGPAANRPAYQANRQPGVNPEARPGANAQPLAKPGAPPIAPAKPGVPPIAAKKKPKKPGAADTDDEQLGKALNIEAIRLLGRAFGVDAEKIAREHGLMKSIDALYKAGAHKYIRRVPTGNPKRPYRYYYRESSIARDATAGEEVSLGKDTVKVLDVEKDGVIRLELNGEQRAVKPDEWSNMLARSYGTRFHEWAEKRAEQSVNAVLKHVPRKLLEDLTGESDEERFKQLQERVPEVYAKLDRAFKQAGINPFRAKTILGAALERRGWEPEARAAAVGSVLTHRTDARRFSEIVQGAENLAGGKRVEAKHVASVVELRGGGPGQEDDFSARVADIAKRAEAELGQLAALLAKAQDGSNDDRAQALAAALASSAIQKLNLLTTAFPGIKDSVATQARDVMLEAASVAPSPEPKRAGAETSVYVAGDNGQPKAIRAKYRLMNASEIIASHDPLKSFKKREDYPENVQERAYHRDQSEQGKVVRNALALNPAFVANTNPDAVNGPPIVMQTEGGAIALGGNSRTMSMQVAYAQHEKKGAELRKYLSEHAHEFGFRPEDVEAMENPVLVREIEPDDRSADAQRLLVRQLNESFTQGMDPRTMQVALGRKLDEQTLGAIANDMKEDETLAGFLASPRSERFVNALMRNGVIDQRNANQYLKKGTKLLNEDGRTLVERVLVGRIVGDADVLSNTGPKLVSNIAAAVPYMVQAKAYGAGYDVGGDLATALSAYNDLQSRVEAGHIPALDPKMDDRRYKGLYNYFDSLFGDKHPIVENKNAQALLELLIRKPGPQQQAAVWRDFVKRASSNPEGQSSLFGAAKSPDEVLRETVQHALKRGDEPDEKPKSAPKQEGPSLF